MVFPKFLNRSRQFLTDTYSRNRDVAFPLEVTTMRRDPPQGTHQQIRQD
jgi:hypothetical protein